MPELKHSELTEKILRCSFEVHSQLGSGFLEKVYENALVFELRECGLSVEQQKRQEVHYKGNVVDDKVIIELKATDKLTDLHEVQLKNYLCATGIEVGLLMNFGKSVNVKRKFVKN